MEAKAISKAEPGSKYLDDEENHQELLNQMPAAERAEWESYGHRRIEPAFQDRVFVVFQPAGKNNAGIQRPPKIISTVRVLSFIARDETGCTVRLLNETTNEVEEIGYVPKKIFGYPIFVSVPPSFALRWDAHRHGGIVKRSLSYILFVKCRNKSSFFSTSNLYLETPNTMRDVLYPHLDLKLDL